MKRTQVSLVILGLFFGFIAHESRACFFCKKCRPNNCQPQIIPPTSGDFVPYLYGGRCNVPLKRIQSVFLLTSKDRFYTDNGEPTYFRKEVCDQVREMMKGYLKNIVLDDPDTHAQVLNPIVLEDDNATYEKLVDAFNNIEVRPSDCLVFFYSGHGAIDNQNHYISISIFDKVKDRAPRYSRNIWHQELRNLVINKHPGLGVIITSSCATELIFRAFPTAQAPVAVKPSGLHPSRDLFLMHRGLVDINGCSPGETTISPIFTESFKYILSPDQNYVSKDEIDNIRSDGFIEWIEAFPVLRDKTNAKRIEIDKKNSKPSIGEHPFPFFLPSGDIYYDFHI
jgi:hypothetical protein